MAEKSKVRDEIDETDPRYHAPSSCMYCEFTGYGNFFPVCGRKDKRRIKCGLDKNFQHKEKHHG